MGDEPVVETPVPPRICGRKQQHRQSWGSAIDIRPDVPVVLLSPVLDSHFDLVAAKAALAQIVRLEVASGRGKTQNVVQIVKHIGDIEGLHDSSLCMFIGVVGVRLVRKLEIAPLSVSKPNKSVLEVMGCIYVVSIGQVSTIVDGVNPAVLGRLRVLRILDDLPLAVCRVFDAKWASKN